MCGCQNRQPLAYLTEPRLSSLVTRNIVQKKDNSISYQIYVYTFLPSYLHRLISPCHP